ncbi:MAG: hypothetical protein C5B47_03650 [Verrucomicrobia bacterium]|nr:MAG: hypothetical protein C5B47_03650 [Verrucomicrobiota bacterium]
MRSLLVALQEGRLVELTDSDKKAALELLSNLIEAIPSVPPTVDIFRMVMEREAHANTALGHAIACPHARTRHEGGELLCAAGWSPTGIDYGASDGVPVHLVCMYYVPTGERGEFLKEMSALARAVEKEANMAAILKSSSLDEVRGHLLNWVSQALETLVPSTHARMIQIARRAVAVPQEGGPGLRLVDVIVIEEKEPRVFALTDDPTLAHQIESLNGLATNLERDGVAQAEGYRIIVAESKALSASRVLYKCAVFLV